MNRPKGKALGKAAKKYERLESRGARPRTLRRLASRIKGLHADLTRRVEAWRAEQV